MMRDLKFQPEIDGSTVNQRYDFTKRSSLANGVLRACRFALLFLLLTASTLLRADETEEVDRFLSRLGLVDLQILHLERSLNQPLGQDTQLRTARRLADLYAARLMDASDDPARYQELLDGIQRLTTRFPKANTTSLEVMLLQADYNRAEKLVGEWIADREQTTNREEAYEILTRIAPQLQSHQDELNKQVDELFEEIGELPDGDTRDEKESELNRVQSIAGRATYFAGWSSYYLGLTRSDPSAASDDFNAARKVFQKVLGLSDEDTNYSKVEVAWLGLESPWRARSVIGLGLAEAAAGNLSGSEAVFEWLDTNAAAPEIRDQAAYWYVQRLINAKQYTPAKNYAAGRIQKFTSSATQGKISLCVALIRTGYSEGASVAARELGPLGIAGLTRMKQFSALKTLIDRYNVDLSKEDDFYSLWILGQQKFDDAEKSKSQKDYQVSEELFTKALAADGAKTDVASAAQCRYNRAWARFRLENFRDAARDFEQAITGLKPVDIETAVQSAWLAHACHRKLIPSSPTAANSAIAMLERIKVEFPDTSFAQRADYHIAKLRNSAASPEESIAALRKIAPGEENYLAARYDLCQLLHGQWRAAAKDAKLASERLTELAEAVDVYLKAAQANEPDRQLACVLRVVDAALAKVTLREEIAGAYLKLADQLAQRVPAGDHNLAEYHYRKLQFARLNGDDTARRKHAQWLVENAAGSPYETAALVILATAIDAQLKDASDVRREELNVQAYDVYTRLTRSFGDSPDVIESTKNARVALSKRAYFAEQTGRHAEAAEALEKLLTAFPKDRDYLRRAALAQYHVGQFDSSLANWSTLLRGLDSGEENWLEAKYYQIACLVETDLAAAAKVYKQFQLLYPELGGAAWASKFQQLGQQFN